MARSTHPWSRRLRPFALAFILYSILALAITWPVAARLTTGIAGDPNRDSLQFVWNLWWQAQALLRFHTNPADVTLLHFPDGGRNELLALSALIPTVALPFTLLLGPVTTYNLFFLASFPLAGLAGYLLTRWVTGSHRAAFVGGLIFGFFPNKTIQGTNHFLQIMVFLFPLYALALLRLLRRPTLRQAIVAGLTLSLALLVNLVHVGFFLVPLSLVLVLAGYRRFGQEPLRRVALVGLVPLIALVLTGPVIIPFIVESLRGALGHLQQPGVVRFSLDLLAYVVPPPTHPLLGLFDTVRRLGEFELRGNFEENVAYLGLIPLALAAIGVRRWPRIARPWLFLAALMALLALGPLLKVGGMPVGAETGRFEVEEVRGSIPLPYMALMQLPFYSWGRIPGRQVMTAMVGLAVLAGLGIAGLPARRRTLLTAVASAAIVAEYLVIWPYPVGPADIRALPVWREIRAEARGAILHLPQWDFFSFPPSNEAMLAQTAHGLALVGGYIHRLPPGAAETAKAIQELVVSPGSPDIVSRPGEDEALRQLRALGIATVVLHRDARSGSLWTDDDDERAARTLTAWSGGPRWENERWAIYDLPGLPEAEPAPLWTLDSHWYSREGDAETARRWMPDRAEAWLWLPEDTLGRLRLDLQAFNGPRTLTVRVNGEPVLVAPVHERETLVSPLVALPQGHSTIALELAEGCQRPTDLDPKANDGRCLGLLVHQLELVPESRLSEEPPERALEGSAAQGKRRAGGRGRG